MERVNKNNKRAWRVLPCILLVILLALIAWIVWGNNALELTTYIVASETLPETFHGYRIAHVSDLHNAEMGRENGKLLEMLRKADPDMIAITGDVIDSRRTDTRIALRFMEEAVKIAPCYFVTGNHEAYIEAGVYSSFEGNMVNAGVTVLRDSEIVIEQGGMSISLTGVDDPDYARKNTGGIGEYMEPDRIRALSAKTEGFTVLLSHRPEFFEQYVSADVELVLSGHAHGGQFRLPFVGGLAAPNQGLFPEYDAGLFVDGNTNMIVSRGIGNSVFPFRVNNRPEVVIIELRQTADIFHKLF